MDFELALWEDCFLGLGGDGRVMFVFFPVSILSKLCGGLFCNNCTLDRLYLRGQGDAPARVCGPCKQIEDAAKFEKYGKGKTRRGGSKASIGKDDGTHALLKQVLETTHDEEVHVESIIASVADHDRDNDHELLSPAQGKSPVSPARLHEQSQEEKKRYSALKKQGKEVEALKAFKRAKELEREAEALEKQIKLQRRVSSDSSSALANKTSTIREDPGSSPDAVNWRKSEVGENSKKRRPPSQDEGKGQVSAPERDDFLSELKALGWSDKEIREADKKPVVKSEEQLLAELTAEVRSKSGQAATRAVAPGPNDAMSMQIMAHKRQALALKREGKLAEAKEELRKSKILEKKAEEMALIGQAEGEDEASDDDELQALIRGLEREEKPKGNAGKKGASSQGFPDDFSTFISFASEDDDADVEVNDNDLDDPEMAAALRAMGFEEDEVSGLYSVETKPQTIVTKTIVATSGPDLKQQILALKRKALALKREGKLAEAKAELSEAKKLEQQLENVISTSTVTQVPARQAPVPLIKRPEPTFDGKPGENEEKEENVEVTDQDMRDPDMMAALRAMGFADDEPAPSSVKPESVDESSLKQQILGIKRQALSLKREGRPDEAREVLRRAKVLEQQLQDLQAVLQRQEETPAIIKQSREARRGARALPALSGFPNLDEEGVEEGEENVEVDNADLVDPDIAAALAAVGWQEDPVDLFVADSKKDDRGALGSDPMPSNQISSSELQPPQEAEIKKVDIVQAGMKESDSGFSTKSLSSPATPIHVSSSKTKSELQKELLGRKRRALALKRDGKSEEARIELREAKIIEEQLAELEKGLATVVPPTAVVKSIAPAAVVQTAHPPPASEHFSMLDSESARPVYLDDEPVDEVEVTEDDMQDPVMLSALARLGLLDEKKESGPSKSIPTTGKKEPPGGSSNPLDALAQTRISEDRRESLLDFDWGIPRGHAKKASYETGDKKKQVVKNSTEDIPFEGEYGEIGQTLDIVPPLLGQQDTAARLQQRQSSGLVGLPSGEQSKSTASLEHRKNSQSKMLPPFPLVSTNPKERSMLTPKPAIDAAANVQPSTPTLQQEILALKRKALTLKREGKTGEAKEELRKAKLLERQITDKQEPQAAVLTSAAGSASAHRKVDEISSIARASPSSPEPPPVTVKTSPPSKNPGHKEEMQKQVRQTKDRMKLQQESLAHKRKAMGLRRQGKTEEADSEYELAKELEKQMEDLDPMHGKEDLGEVAGVEDLLDPQLLAALKGVGFREGDLNGPVHVPTQATGLPQSSNVGSSSRSSAVASSRPVGVGASEAERKQLEEKIRAQKLQAVQLKRAGKQGEALEKLRGAKQLEKRLLALTS